MRLGRLSYTVVVSNAFGGRVGQAITDDINNVHVMVLVGLDRAYTLLLAEYTKLLGQFKDHVGEHDDKAILDEGVLIGLKEQLVRFDQDKTGLDQALRVEYGRG